MAKFWHAFGRVEETIGGFLTVIAGPTPKGPDELDNNGTPIREATVNGAPYIRSFDHEPTNLEKDQLAPDEWRQLDDEGNLLPWNDEEDS